MKICLISDSHGNRKGLRELVENNNFDMLLFMGDGLRDLNDIEGKIEIHKVAGNCDFFSDEPLIEYIFANGRKICITHGHNFKAKQTKGFLVRQAKEEECDILCFGHSHIQSVEIIKGIYIINPGAFSHGKYAVLNIDKDGDISVKTYK